jgi:hypothetical protein
MGSRIQSYFYMLKDDIFYTFSNSLYVSIWLVELVSDTLLIIVTVVTELFLRYETNILGEYNDLQ